MLLSHTVDEWNEAYISASAILVNLPFKKDELDDIYNRPSYYAGYYFRNITGILNCYGSTVAEQNHFSITAYYRNSDAWTIIYQINKLMERQFYFISKDCTKSDNLFMVQHNFDSEFNGDLRVHDTPARLSLSDYAHKNLWLKFLKRKDNFQHKMMHDGVTSIVWPVGEI